MKKLTLLIMGLIILTAGCRFTSSNKVRGSGTVKTEKRSVAQFTSLDVNCGISLQVDCQAPGSLEISGDDNIVSLITTEVKNDTLYIRASEEYDPDEELRIIASTPDLKKVVFAGSGDTRLSNIKNDSVEVVLTGAGSIAASGETKEATFTLSGVGSIDAKDLHAINAKVNSIGVGSVDIYATDYLDAKSSGIGEINYFGSPKTVSKKVSGIGSINER